MRWMAWTLPSAVFFALIVGAIVGLLIWELVSPTVARRGFLPMPTDVIRLVSAPIASRRGFTVSSRSSSAPTRMT